MIDYHDNYPLCKAAHKQLRDLVFRSKILIEKAHEKLGFKVNCTIDIEYLD